MFATIPASLLTTLQAAPRGIIAAKSTLPVLSCVRLSVPAADPFQLCVEATDLDLHLLRTVTLTEPAVAGAICVPYTEFSRLRPAGAVMHLHLDAASDYAIFTDSAGGAVHRMETLPAEEFPNAPPWPHDGPATTLPDRWFADLERVLPFASADVTRYVINGVLAAPGVMVATDGRRLIALDSAGPPVPVIIPTKHAKVMAGLFGGSGAAAALDPKANRMALSDHAGITLHARLIDGNYPNWQQVVPAEFNGRITFADPEAVIAFTTRLNKSRKKSAPIALYPHTRHTVRLNHPQGSLIAAAAITGDFPGIAFDPAFFAVCLKAIGPTLHFIDSMSPALFRAPSARAVLMPCRVEVAAPAKVPLPTPAAAAVPATA